MSHTHVFETASIARLFERIAEEGGDCSVVLLCDSHVAWSVVARARSSSRSLKFIMKKICALSLGFAIYGAGRFAYKMEFSRSSDKEFYHCSGSMPGCFFG